MSDSILTVGSQVEDFEMDSYNPVNFSFEKFLLKDVRKSGKWTILFFYPADFTFVCPTELKDLAERHNDLEKMGCEVVSVSTDTTFSHMAWRNSEKLLENLNFKMGADPTGKLARKFGVYDEESGLALRGTFVINPEGKLVSSEVSFDNVGRNADELVRKMEAHEYLMGHPNEACPAKWKKGEKTLTPSEKIVGKVYEALQE